VVQVPKLDWQPAKQKADVFPQKPEDEQQSPKVEPLHVLPFVPHLPSIEMLSVEVQVPKPVWHPAPQNSLVRPQKPLDEQQSPKEEPPHDLPLAPHLPSVDRFGFPPSEHVPKSLWQPAVQ
jgi:hypothetical protein